MSELHKYYYSKLFNISKEEFEYYFSDVEDVALVGNSGILEGSGYGEKIDRHSCVVRFNDAPVEGYEKDVGSKTNFRFLNVLHQRGGTLEHTTGGKRNYISTIQEETLILKNSIPDIRKKAEKKIGSNCDSLYITKQYRDIYRTILNKFLRVENSVSYILSLGMQGILIFLPISARLNLFGYNLYQEEDPSKYHYWEEFTEDRQGPHRYDREKELLKKVENIEKVRIFK